MKPYVYLVGAGPGDEGLITIKGLECIKKADVILYDRLININLLKYKKEGAVCIDVGKEPDKHQYTQNEINQLLVDEAKKGYIVTRLKGGDPYVFGRGGEEAMALYSEGIPFEVVPGITSAIGAASYAGIPVTHRNVSTSFHVITGHEAPSKGRSTVNYEALAKLDGTLIFLMGVRNLSEITKELIKHGKDGKTPVAVIHKGTTASQATVTSDLENIVEVVKVNKITSPSIIVVGEVVALRGQLNWFENLPLHRKRILVTRSRQQASELSRKLKQLGAEAIEFPTIEIKNIKSNQKLEEQISRIYQSSYLIFTSKNGVDSFFENLMGMNLDIRSIGDCKVVAIGSATALALKEKGILVEVLPDIFTGEGVISKLEGIIKPRDNVVIARAEIGRKSIVEGLLKLGAKVEEIHLYQTVIPTYNKNELLKVLHEGIDIITFTSSSTVKNLITILGHENQELLRGVKIAAIGPITADTLKEYGLPIHYQGKEYTIEGLVNSILEDSHETY